MKVPRILIGLLLAALLVVGAGGIGAAIGFRFGMNEGVRRSPEVAEQLRARRQPVNPPVAPPNPPAPGQPQPPQVQPGPPQVQPRGPFGPAWQQPYGPRMMMGRQMPMMGNRPGFGILGGMLRLLVAGLLLAGLVALVMRLMGRGPRWGAPGFGPRWHAHGPPSAPPPWWDEWHRRAHGEPPSSAPPTPPAAPAPPPSADMPPTVRAD